MIVFESEILLENVLRTFMVAVNARLTMTLTKGCLNKQTIYNLPFGLFKQCLKYLSSFTLHILVCNVVICIDYVPVQFFEILLQVLE